MTESTVVARLARRMRAEESAGLRLAVQGRLVVLAVLAVFSVAAFSGALLANTLVYIAAFALLSAALLLINRGERQRAWAPYLFVLMETALLAQAVLTPNPFNPDPWPGPMVYRYDNFYYFFVLLAVSVFSLSPRMVLWTGMCIAGVWGCGLLWVLSMPQAQIWGEAISSLTSEEQLASYLDPNMVLLSGRVKEMMIAVLVAGLLAAVVARGRRVIERLVAVDSDRRVLRETFGKYLPEHVARAVLEDQGSLAPQYRTASILFVDLAGFTSLVQKMDPDEVLVLINAWFEAAGEVIMRNGGIINQYQGDAVLATFNVPVDDPQHASNAVSAGRELLELVQTRSFAGQKLAIRIGVNTGEVVAGSVGSSRRLSYTVHGDAVNLAARLEQMNKETGTTMLVSEHTVASLGEQQHGLQRIATLAPRGRAEAVTVYAPPGMSAAA